MQIKKIAEVPAQDVEMEGAKDVKVRVLFGPKDGAPTFAMRIFELAGGGHTPFHTHPFEHEVMILEGAIALVTENGDIPLAPGDAAMVGPGELHQFKNLSGSDKAVMQCIVPVEYQK